MTSEERREVRYQRRKAKRNKPDKNDNFYHFATTNAIIRAHLETKRGVMWKASAAKWHRFFLSNSVRTSGGLISQGHKSLGYISFTINSRGKVRNVHSLHYEERVIRRSLCTNCLLPVLSKHLIYDNGASIKGKGTDFSVRQCEKHLHKLYKEDGTNEGYILQVDFKQYFDNIVKVLLHEELSRYFKDTRLLNVMLDNIYSANVGSDKGIYIGPEDSQVYALFYPNSIDHKIKDMYGLLYYNRFADDSYIMHKDKSVLEAVLNNLLIEYEKFGIVPNIKKTKIVKVSKGFVYLKRRFLLTESGKVIKRPCKKSIVRQKRKLRKLKKKYDAGEVDLQSIKASYMSYIGGIKRTNAHKLIRDMNKLFYALFGEYPMTKKERRKYEQRKYEQRADRKRDICKKVASCGF